MYSAQPSDEGRSDYHLIPGPTRDPWFEFIIARELQFTFSERFTYGEIYPRYRPGDDQFAGHHI